MKRYFKFLIFIIISTLCSIFIAQSIRLKLLGVYKEHRVLYLTDSRYFDAKFRHFVFNAPDSINSMAMGSSMSLSIIYSQIIHELFPHSIFYNYAAEATTIPTTVQTVKKFCKEYPIKNAIINCQIIDFGNSPFYKRPSEFKLSILKHKSIYLFSSQLLPDGFKGKYKLEFTPNGSRSNVPINPRRTTEELKNGTKLQDLINKQNSINNFHNSYRALNQLCKFLKNNKINLFISISPLSHYYLETKNDSIFYDNFIDSCNTIISKNGYILHHIDNETFTDQDFRDSYHLSYDGTIKFKTLLLKELLLDKSLNKKNPSKS